VVRTCLISYIMDSEIHSPVGIEAIFRNPFGKSLGDALKCFTSTSFAGILRDLQGFSWLHSQDRGFESA